MNNDLKNKMHNYEVTPPARVWENINTSLDEAVNAKFPSKLFNLEIPPPATAWNKIINTLDADKPVGSTSEKRKIIPFTRYAAAAAVIGLIALAVVWIMNTTSPQNIAQPLPAPKNEKAAAASPVNPVIATGKSLTADKPTVNEKKLIAKADVKRAPVYISSGAAINAPVQLANTFSVDNLQEKYPAESPAKDIYYDPSKIVDDNPYIMFIRPDGYVIRISKKIATMLDCLYNLYPGQDEECKNQLQKWREKIVQSPINASSGNFPAMLDLIKSIQEN